MGNYFQILGEGVRAKMASFYCVKCRTKREDPNAQAVTMKNGKKAMKRKVSGLRNWDVQNRRLRTDRIGMSEAPYPLGAFLMPPAFF